MGAPADYRARRYAERMKCACSVVFHPQREKRGYQILDILDFYAKRIFSPNIREFIVYEKKPQYNNNLGNFD
jgi:hypothetical protein